MKMISLILLLTLASSISHAKPSYGISQGTVAPAINTYDVNENSFNLKKTLQSSPVVLVFYRGGWCPYCNTQLRSLQKDVVPKLKAKNVQLVAISVDNVNEALKTKNKEKLSMTIISDPDAKILKSYNVSFKVPEKLVKKYKSEYKIDLEKASSRKHHTIAIPAVFLIGKDGKVAFAYANEDYKIRAQNKDILSALNKITMR